MSRVHLAGSEFDLDSDELDDATLSQLDDLQLTPPGHHDQSMPLLVGLLDASARRSLDGSLSLRPGNGTEEHDIDLEQLAAKSSSGGGMIDSVANMANSILGAGKLTAHPHSWSRNSELISLCQE
jgi:solute carrier family 38 (sodium-coupled neutral amino acid transporter), member 11